jgi:hypothetical protein
MVFFITFGMEGDGIPETEDYLSGQRPGQQRSHGRSEAGEEGEAHSNKREQEESHRALQGLRAAEIPGSTKEPGEAAGFMEWVPLQPTIPASPPSAKRYLGMIALT